MNQAAAGAVELGDLAGGLGLESVTDLEGWMIDGEDQVIPTLRIDYGLVTVPPSDLRREAEALQTDANAESRELADLLDLQESESRGLVVEVVTADYSQARTHVGPGDQALLDLTFVESLAPGADVAMSYIFGQTLPGDPEIEEGLQPLELFRYRWNQGLIAVLGDPDSAAGAPVADYSVEIIDGSTLSSGSDPLLFGASLPVAWTGQVGESPSLAPIAAPAALLAADGEPGTDSEAASELKLSKRQIKQLILLNTTRRAEEMIQSYREEGDLLSEFYDDLDEGEAIYTRLPNGQLLVISPDLNEVILVSDLSDFDPDCEGEGCPSLPAEDVVAEGTFEDMTASLIITSSVLSECREKAAQLNRRNGAQTHIKDSNGRVEIFGDDPVDQGDDEEEDDANDDPLAPQPGPVGCTPGLPSGPPKWPTGATWGDIHLGTMDGKRYSNQAAGEFLLFENEATTIQVRTEPRAGNVVSLATAIAFTMGDQAVSLHAGGTTRINGEAAQLERGVPTPLGGGELLWWSGGWVAVWPDGTILRVNQSGSLMFSSVTPSDGATTGMLGNNDGDPDNDFFTRDGEVLDADADEDFDSFYSTYVDSWRIAAAESLFYYDPGDSTAAFTIEGVPVEPVTADDLPADAFADAEQICTEVGVDSTDVLEMCILDVGITGDAAFAYESYLAQEAISEPPEEDVSDEAPSVSGEGDSVLTVGDLTIAFGADPPIQDPSGPRPSWTCQSADGIYTAISRFQESPTIRYELDLQHIGPDNSRGLPEQFRLIVLRNAEPYAWVLTSAEQFANSVDTVVVQGEVLTASGEMFLNEPPQPGLQPISQLPAGAALDRFDLSVSCGG